MSSSLDHGHPSIPPLPQRRHPSINPRSPPLRHSSPTARLSLQRLLLGHHCTRLRAGPYDLRPSVLFVSFWDSLAG
ncbi:hypothetical protein BDY24DRAFT_398837 [Mrakia frigida]|uniref:uncharacterized protein n=1 Tax=Mrakia frigida TaxID=29902 RepID=UPI003FCBFBE9